MPREWRASSKQRSRILAAAAAARHTPKSGSTSKYIHAVAAAQKVPQIPLKAQYLLISFAILQLVAAASTMLGKAVGSSSPGLTATVRILLLTAPLVADTDINPMIFHVLFIGSVLWTILAAAALVYAARSGTSIERYVLRLLDPNESG